MAEFITLTNHAGDSLVIDQQGAYIVRLQGTDGTDVVLPSTRIGEKLRGGIPVCAPIFGPGDSVGLPQHGFARTVHWDVTTISDNAVFLRAAPRASERRALPETYYGLSMRLGVELHSSQLEMTLILQNDGALPCVVSPAFHPYFPVHDATAIRLAYDGIDGRQFSAEELAATQFLHAGGMPVTVRLDAAEVTLESNELQQYAVWSGNPDMYICVEPSAAGNLPADIPQQWLLSPGTARRYAMRLGWRLL